MDALSGQRTQADQPAFERAVEVVVDRAGAGLAVQLTLINFGEQAGLFQQGQVLGWRVELALQQAGQVVDLLGRRNPESTIEPEQIALVGGLGIAVVEAGEISPIALTAHCQGDIAEEPDRRAGGTRSSGFAAVSRTRARSRSAGDACQPSPGSDAHR